jgi:hypothetical protein
MQTRSKNMRNGRPVSLRVFSIISGVSVSLGEIASFIHETGK